jgi:hypothetical protein
MKGNDMVTPSGIFEKHYADYCARISKIDLRHLAHVLGTEYDGERMMIPFFNQTYRVSSCGITDESGNRPDYVRCVILAKYILLCPESRHHDTQWVSFKDFKKTSHFTNVNFFESDTEQAICKHYTGRCDDLARAGKLLGGMDDPMTMSYDLSMQFKVLPRISLLLVFNDGDDEFPPQCKVLFQKHAEFYLDPESLAMTGALLAGNLKKACDRSTGADDSISRLFIV